MDRGRRSSEAGPNLMFLRIFKVDRHFILVFTVVYHSFLLVSRVVFSPSYGTDFTFIAQSTYRYTNISRP